MSAEEDLSELCSSAKSMGAAKVSVLPAGSVVVDERVRLKCMVPACPNYGVNLMCPPRTVEPSRFSKILDGYAHAVLIQYPMDAEGELPVSDGGEGNGFHRTLREFNQMLCDLEREAVNRGYRFAAALTGGPCVLCDQCVGQSSGAPCRKPMEARPSMEAMGIDVFRTAEKAGMPIRGKEEPLWTGLLLVD
ncbi:MAG: DUF2284 domain-containing protein [Methanomassiliicoccales archaeon]